MTMDDKAKPKMPPVDDPRSINGKRGKAFAVPVKATWDQIGSPGRGPFNANDGKQVLHQSLGYDGED
jgi:hypothetical protein